MELKNKKSAWAALATLGVTAIAAGATAFVKIRDKRRQREEEEKSRVLSEEQEMVYNDAVRAFITLNEHIYELRHLRKELQPLIQWLATDGNDPLLETEDEDLNRINEEIRNFIITQLPFINAVLATIYGDGTAWADVIRGAVGGSFDPTLDEDSMGSKVEKGAPIQAVLKLGYCFPHSRIATHSVKSIVLV